MSQTIPQHHHDEFEMRYQRLPSALEEWSQGHVGVWLTKHGFRGHQERFKQARVDGKRLTRMAKDKELLRDLGLDEQDVDAIHFALIEKVNSLKDTRGNLLTIENEDMFRLTSLESMYKEIQSEVTRLKKSASRTSSSRSRSGVRLVSYDSEDESSLLQTDSESEEEPTSWNQPEPAVVPQRTHENLGYSDTESSEDSASEFEQFDLPDSISSRPSKLDFSDLAQFYTPPPIRKKKPQVQRDPNPYGITCPNGHDLKFDSGHMKVCSSCKKTMSSGYCCKCDFAMCEDCYEDVHESLQSDKAPTTTTKSQSMRKPPKGETIDTPGKKKRKQKKINKRKSTPEQPTKAQPKKRKRKGRKARTQKESEPIPEFLQEGRKLRIKRTGRRKKRGKKKFQERVVISPDAVEISLDDTFEISVETVQTPVATNPSRESSPQPPSTLYVNKYSSGLSLSDSGSNSVPKRHISSSYSRPSPNNTPLSHTLVNKRPSDEASSQMLLDPPTSIFQINVLAGAEPLIMPGMISSVEPELPPEMQARHSKSRSRRHSYRKEQSATMSDPRTSTPVESPPPSNLPTYATRSSSSPNCKPVDGIWDWVGSEGLDRYLAHIGHGLWSRTFISLFGQERLHLKVTERTVTCTRTRSSTNSSTTTFQLREQKTFSNFQGEEITLRPGSTYEDGILCMTFRSKHGHSRTKRYVDANGDLVWETDFTGTDEAQTKLKFTLWYSVAQF